MIKPLSTKPLLEALEAAIPSSTEKPHKIYREDENIMLHLSLPNNKSTSKRITINDLTKPTDVFISEIAVYIEGLL